MKIHSVELPLEIPVIIIIIIIIIIVIIISNGNRTEWSTIQGVIG